MGPWNLGSGGCQGLWCSLRGLPWTAFLPCPFHGHPWPREQGTHTFLGWIPPGAKQAEPLPCPVPLASPGLQRQGSHPSSLQEVGSQG